MFKHKVLVVLTNTPDNFKKLIGTILKLFVIGLFIVSTILYLNLSKNLNTHNIWVKYIVFSTVYCALCAGIEKRSDFLNSLEFTFIFVLWPPLVLIMWIYSLTAKSSVSDISTGWAYLLFSALAFATSNLTAFLQSSYIGITTQKWKGLKNTVKANIVYGSLILFYSLFYKVGCLVFDLFRR